MLSVIMLNVLKLSVVMLNVIMLSVIMLSVIMLNVVMLSVVAPFFNETENTNKNIPIPNIFTFSDRPVSDNKRMEECHNFDWLVDH